MTDRVLDAAWDAFRAEEARDIPAEEFPHDARRCVDAAARVAQVAVLREMDESLRTEAKGEFAPGIYVTRSLLRVMIIELERGE